LTVIAHRSSLNRGPEQDKLDGVAETLVEVTALAPPIYSTPHVELLCYRGRLRTAAGFRGGLCR
jgi:hypothetical protein